MLSLKQEEKNPLDPDDELIKNIELLSEGSVLDIACGDGRNSLFLLDKGFQLTGVDFSIEALNRLNHFAALNDFEVSTIQIDLSKKKSLDSIGCFDNIIVNHYRLPDHQMEYISERLKEDGVLFLTGFGHKHKQNEKIKEKDLICRK